MTPCHASRVHSLLIRDLVRFTRFSSRRGVGKQLNMARLVEQIKPIDCFFDGLADGQDAVVAQESRFLVAEGGGDVAAFILG